MTREDLILATAPHIDPNSEQPALKAVLGRTKAAREGLASFRIATANCQSQSRPVPLL